MDETLEAGGTRARAYLTGDLVPGSPGVVVFHAWWGLNRDVIGYADRLAAGGLAVLAPDLADGRVVAAVEDADELSSSLDGSVTDAISLAAVDRLADRLGPTARLATVGFSMGAPWAVWVPAERDRVVASVVYYGAVGGPVLARSSVPVLGHFAETDPFEPEESVTAFEAGLRSAGREVAIHRYPGTGHWFAEPSRDAYRPAAADLAFERTVAFLERHLRSRTG